MRRTTKTSCPLCHHPAVRVLSVAESLGTIIVQCTGCLQESTLPCVPPTLDDDAEE
jgi:hypothetical protein